MTIWHWVSHQNFFPSLLIFLYVCSAVRYALSGDYGRTLYWAAAMLITISVTFCMRH